VNLESDDDSELTSMIKKDSLKAFEQLYHRYKKKLYCFSLKYVENSFEAEEIVQIVFINTWDHRKTLDENQSVRSYLYKSVVNLVYNSLKKKAIRSKYINRELLNPEKAVNQTYELIFFKELEAKIETVISQLPPQQQKILNYSRFEGLSPIEIAEKLELSVRTVENQIYRASKILREQIKNEIAS